MAKRRCTPCGDGEVVWHRETSRLIALGTLPGMSLAGAAAGAALGSVVAGDDNRLEGAVIGGIAGAAAGSLIGRNSQGQCIYRRANGTTFVGPC